MKISLIGAVIATAMATVVPTAHADRAEPPPLYGYYNLLIDFSKQTFNSAPTPMTSMTFPVPFITHCDVNGCVATMDNSDDHARNPDAPMSYDYRWTGDRWETSGDYPYFCDRNDPNSVVTAQRSDFWVPKPGGTFVGERTLVIGGAGCPGEGPGTHRVPTALTPIDPPPAG